MNDTLLPPKWFLTVFVVWLAIASPFVILGIGIAEELIQEKVEK